jgi:hypothetical protein
MPSVAGCIAHLVHTLATSLHKALAAAKTYYRQKLFLTQAKMAISSKEWKTGGRTSFIISHSRHRANFATFIIEIASSTNITT